MKATQMLLLAIAMIGVAHGLPLAGPSPEEANPVIPDKAKVDSAVEEAKAAAESAGESVSSAAKDAVKSIQGFMAEKLPEAEKQVGARAIEDESIAPVEEAKEIVIEGKKSDDLIEPEPIKEEEVTPEAAIAARSDEIAPKIEENNEAEASALVEEAKRALPVENAESKPSEKAPSEGAVDTLRTLEEPASSATVETEAAKDEPKKETSPIDAETVVTEEKTEPIAEKQEPVNVAEYASRGASIAEESVDTGATALVQELPKEATAVAEEASVLPASKSLESSTDDIAAKSVVPIEELEVPAPVEATEISGKSEAVAPIAEEKTLAEDDGKSLIGEAKKTIEETKPEGQTEIVENLGLENKPIELEKRSETEPTESGKSLELKSSDIEKKSDEEVVKIDSEEPAKLGTAEALTQTEQLGKPAEAAAAATTNSGNEESAQAGISPQNSSEESSEEEKGGAEKPAEKSEDGESSEEESQEKKIS